MKKETSYVHYKDIIAMLEKVLKSKHNQLGWLKDEVTPPNAIQEMINDVEETIKHTK